MLGTERNESPSKHSPEHFTVKYLYTPERIKSFCRVHLWYHKRQHPLLLKVPGIFLLLCLAWYLLSGTRGSISGVTLCMMFLFEFILLWMGFIHPLVFCRTLLRELSAHPAGEMTLRFFDDRVEAISNTTRCTYSYTQIDSGYITQQCIYLYTGDQALLVPADVLSAETKPVLQSFLQEKLFGKLHVRKAA